MAMLDLTINSLGDIRVNIVAHFILWKMATETDGFK